MKKIHYSFKYFSCLYSLIFLSIQNVWAQNCTSAEQLSQLNVVKRAYKIDELDTSSITSSLKLLFDRDALCVEQTGGLCNYDSDPLGIPQDPPPSKTELSIDYQCHSDTVIAKLLDKRKGVKQSESTFSVIFMMVRENGQWKIDNIRYPYPGESKGEFFSLKESLSRPFPN